jgi:hypothetical protein
VFEVPASPQRAYSPSAAGFGKESIRRYLTENSGHSNRSAHTNVSLPNVEKALWAWIQDMEVRNRRLNGGLIRAKGRQLAIEMGVPPYNMM